MFFPPCVTFCGIVDVVLSNQRYPVELTHGVGPFSIALPGSLSNVRCTPALSGALSTVESTLDKVKENASDKADEAKNSAAAAVDSAKSAVGSAAEAVKDKAADVASAVKEKTQDVKEGAADAAQKGADKVKEILK